MVILKRQFIKYLSHIVNSFLSFLTGGRSDSYIFVRYVCSEGIYTFTLTKYSDGTASVSLSRQQSHDHMILSQGPTKMALPKKFIEHFLRYFIVICFGISFVLGSNEIHENTGSEKVYMLGQTQQLEQDYLARIFADIEKNTTVTVKHLENYFQSEIVTLFQSIQSDCISSSNIVNITCLVYGQYGCLTQEDLATLTGELSNPAGPDVFTLGSLIVNLLNNTHCDSQAMDTVVHAHVAPSTFEVWGYGILCTTVINLCALGGMVALPFIHGTLYKKILIYMVGLAVGTLSGSSLLFLIPEALELTEKEHRKEHSYVWKCLTVIIGLYTFFVIERLLKLIMERKEARKYKKIEKKSKERDTAIDFASFHNSPPVPSYKNVDTLPHVSPCGKGDDSYNSSVSDDMDLQNEECQGTSENKIEEDENPRANGQLVPKKHYHHHSHSNTAHIEPVAWMVIFGDGLHNFIDGVSIGAAFTESILAGISVSIAILCEELPHELGDFAVLLNAGMKVKKALLYNFLSATMCYLGLVLGIVLGENTATHTWVFAFAGGMFLYISLVDMMPEMNSAAESEDNLNLIGKKWMFLLQNLGLWTGFTLMMLMAVYGENIEAAVRGH